MPARVNIADVYNNRDELIEGAKKTADTIGLKSATITSMDVTQNDTVITVDLTVLSTQDLTMDRPLPTNWRFDWENRGTGWLLDRIEPLDTQQVSKRDIVSHMQH
ncbi:MAG: hypothetical protein JO353_11500 [Phycisphaerae bacterium]|nr:hypothetical protein [Phycisphaerae bacterium]